MRRGLVVVTSVIAIAIAGAWPAVARSSSPTPMIVRTSQRWSVTARSIDDPLATPTGPATGAGNHPASGCSTSTAATHASSAGEGLVFVTMAAPGTDWASGTDTSLVVELQVDNGPAQQIVLFAGARPFRYEGFVGALAAGAHCVTITVRPDLSHVSAASPVAEVYAVSLGVVPADSPSYVLESHAPVLYGRSASAQGDTPLITYGQQAPDPDGVNTDLTYTIVWTHEDVGDGVGPSYEWGLWGRMTDIETVIHEKVAPGGQILFNGTTYLSCGCEDAPVYPDAVPEDPLQGGETDKPYPATGAAPGIGHH